ncbi:hypothetical protein OUZ56_010437 [Daphnia magna]|uniref:Uncharacterized protein n=1 Tax=Daphnia magna TaxID=35525 RepID=A0ABR0AIJ1_9CRUS|nr:hypothetical protein OUZ56_010437 [Daphnia magna]
MYRMRRGVFRKKRSGGGAEKSAREFVSVKSDLRAVKSKEDRSFQPEAGRESYAAGLTRSNSLPDRLVPTAVSLLRIAPFRYPESRDRPALEAAGNDLDVMTAVRILGSFPLVRDVIIYIQMRVSRDSVIPLVTMHQCGVYHSDGTGTMMLSEFLRETVLSDAHIGGDDFDAAEEMRRMATDVSRLQQYATFAKVPMDEILRKGCEQALYNESDLLTRIISSPFSNKDTITVSEC